MEVATWRADRAAFQAAVALRGIAGGPVTANERFRIWHQLSSINFYFPEPGKVTDPFYKPVFFIPKMEPEHLLSTLL